MSGEFEPTPEPITTGQAVFALKSAQAVLFASPLRWTSEDEKYKYMAVPVLEPEEEGINLATIGDMPMAQFVGILNKWQLARVSEADEDGDVAVDHFMIEAGAYLRHAKFIIPAGLIEEANLENVSKFLQDNADLQVDLGLDVPNSEDYEILNKAVSRIRAIADAEFSAVLERRSTMSEDEKRWERLQKYSWLLTPEIDKNGGPKWWGISEGSLLYAVKSATPDVAALMIEDSRDGRPMLPFFFVDLYPDDVQEQLEEVLEDQDVVRLIPFSIVPWPEDPDNMTDAQKAAFDRLKRD